MLRWIMGLGFGIVLALNVSGAEGVQLVLKSAGALYAGNIQNPVDKVIAGGEILAASRYAVTIFENNVKADSVFHAGNYTLVATVTDGTYAGKSDTQLFTVIPRTLQVVPLDQTIAHGSAPGAYTYRYETFAGQDNEKAITVVSPATLSSSVNSFSPVGVYSIMVDSVGVIRSRDYVLSDIGGLGEITVAPREIEIVMDGVTPNPVELPKTGSATVTLGARVKGVLKPENNTLIDIALSGSGKNIAKLNKKTFNFSELVTSDSVQITLTLRDTMPVNGYTLTVALYSKNPSVTTAASAQILIRSQTVPRTSFKGKIGFVSTKGVIRASEAGVARIYTDSIVSGASIDLLLTPSKGLLLFDVNQKPIPSPYAIKATTPSTTLFYKLESPGNAPFSGNKSASIKIKSAEFSVPGKTISITHGHLSISVKNDHPYFKEVPTYAVLTDSRYRPDSVWIDPSLFARTADDPANNLALLTYGLDTRSVQGSTYRSPLGSVTTLDGNRFNYDYTHLNVPPETFRRGFTDSFPVSVFQTGGSSSKGICYISYGKPASRGSRYEISRSDFQRVTGFSGTEPFAKVPSVFGTYFKPFARRSPAAKDIYTKTLFKLTYDKVRLDTVIAEYTRNIRLYNQREINKLRTYQYGAVHFLDIASAEPAAQRSGVGININVKSKDPGQKSVTACLGTVVVSAPVADSLFLAADSGWGKDTVYLLIVQGKYFGFRPSTYLEYRNTAKKASIRVKRLPLVLSPKNPEKTKWVINLSTGKPLMVPTAAEMRGMSQEHYTAVFKLPKKLPVSSDKRIDLLINSGSAYGGRPSIEAVLP